MSRKHIVICLLLLIPISSLAIETVGRVTEVKVNGDGVELHSGQIAVRISAMSPSIIRVRYSRTGAFPEKKSFAVVEDTGLTAQSVRVTDNKNDLVVDTGLFNARIDKDSTRVIFEVHSGKVILQDHRGYPVTWNGTEFRIWKTMPAEEHYFGMGDKAGLLDRRGHAYTNWNSDTPGFGADTDPIYRTIPFFIGMNGPSAYGVFLDNTYWSSFDFGKETRDAISFGAEDGELDYFFFYGPDPKAVVGEYVQLTGRTPLPPLFMLGYQQCRWTYSPESRAREVAQQFRSHKIPADVIWFDIGLFVDLNAAV